MEERRSERGWSTLRVIKSRPSRSPLYIHPDFIYPPVHPKSTCIRVCGGENPHNVNVARPWTQPGAERRRMASASRGRTRRCSLLTTSSANHCRQRKPLLQRAFLDEASPRGAPRRRRRHPGFSWVTWKRRDADSRRRRTRHERSSGRLIPAAASLPRLAPTSDVRTVHVTDSLSLFFPRLFSWWFSFPAGVHSFSFYPLLAPASSPISVSPDHSVSLSPRCIERSVHDSANERDRAHPLWTSLVACRPSGAVILVCREDGIGVPSVINNPWIAFRSRQCAVVWHISQKDPTSDFTYRLISVGCSNKINLRWWCPDKFARRQIRERDADGNESGNVTITSIRSVYLPISFF